MNGSTTSPICPCDTITNPWVVFNPPGLQSIAYRWGDFTSFRYGLLQALPGEASLSQVVDNQLKQIWHPSGQGDLALQMVEWWAYLADILTFYCQRIGMQTYLGTADLPESVNRLIQLLGYRPRPALAANGVLAGLLGGTKSVTLPQGFQIQSKPGPGQQPQVFELTNATTIATPSLAPVTAPPPAAPLLGGTDAHGDQIATLLIAGTVGGLKAGDEVLLIEQGWVGTDGNWGVGTVQHVSPQKDPAGATDTSVTIVVTSPGSSLGGNATRYRILKSSGTTTLYQYAAGAAQSSAVMIPVSHGVNGYVDKIALSAITRQIVVGDPIVIEDPSPGATNRPLAASVTAYAETIYYANNPDHPATQPTPPPNGTVIPIAMPVSVITFATQGALFGDPTTIAVRYGWKDLGTLVDPPVATTGGTTSAAPVALQTPAAGGFAAPPGTPVLVEDANGAGAVGSINTANSVQIPAPAPALTAPISVLFNLLAVTRGKTVANEVLGSGDGAVLGQDFTLQSSPVTYLQDAASISGDDYSSTVKVWVNSVQWQEVRSFYGQPASAQVFLTREDEQGKTHVVFNGRLPTGVNNVTASYRYGAGAQSPSPGTLSVILQPQPGLQAIVNPVAPSGGADADPPAKIRRLAPLSVMAFNRAVSLEDYRVIAGNAPGVARAAAAYVFDSASQRPLVTVWVGDDDGAVAAAQAALAAAADPNRLPIVKPAIEITMSLSLTYVRDPRHQDSTVQAALQTALIDPDTGLFGTNVIAIGQVFYDSQIYAACLAVPGVQAIHALSFAAPAAAYARTMPLGIARPALAGIDARPPIRIPWGPGLFRQPPVCAGERYDPGPGGFYAVPPANLQLSGTVAP